ncbi:hypothetical protein [Actinoplanes sp. RD1]|uniref:hypothetical protein n=1 Tax=Actinoplanes sp. RD1 TaxID=3064538 RepID=UPI002741491E|nr:hypothetical protein [Actinoplanes sp. RD1]
MSVLPELLDRFAAGSRPVASLDDAVAELGWEPTTRSGGTWREWINGDVVAYSHRTGGVESFTLVTLSYEPEDGDDLSPLYERFEAGLAELTAEVAGRLGPATARHAYGDAELPVPEEILEAALWTGGEWTVMAAFQHEDREAAMRLALWLFRERRQP